MRKPALFIPDFDNRYLVDESGVVYNSKTRKPLSIQKGRGQQKYILIDSKGGQTWINADEAYKWAFEGIEPRTVRAKKEAEKPIEFSPLDKWINSFWRPTGPLSGKYY